PADHLADLGHHLGPDPVAGQDQETHRHLRSPCIAGGNKPGSPRRIKRQQGAVRDYSPSVPPMPATTRSVRLMRPPPGTSVPAPNMIRSTPWKARRAAPPITATSPERRIVDSVGPLRV